jgi:hypothetical protein
MRAGFVDEGNLGAALAAQCVAEPCGQFESAGPSADDNNAVWLTHLVSMARPLPATCAVIISYSWECGGCRTEEGPRGHSRPSLDRVATELMSKSTDRTRSSFVGVNFVKVAFPIRASVSVRRWSRRHAGENRSTERLAHFGAGAFRALPLRKRDE